MAKFETFDYGIKTGGKCIAVFVIEDDRDRALDTLQEFYSDCDFEPVNDWGTSVVTIPDELDDIDPRYRDDNENA